MADWDAGQYLKFADERTRPARDLLARVPLTTAVHVIDLGCGPGNSTELLADRFPGAIVVGLDSSPDMVAEARARRPDLSFVQADLATWVPDTPPDLIFANAVLQWLPDHAALLPRLVSFLAPGGCLAVQMPVNLDEPSHRLMRAVAAEEPFAARGTDPGRERLAEIPAYYGWFADAGCSVDIWRTTYVHPLADADAIVEWVKGTGLRPFLDRLDADGRRAFLARYRARIAEAYPPQTDGRVLLPFPRLLMVARRLSSA